MGGPPMGGMPGGGPSGMGGPPMGGLGGGMGGMPGGGPPGMGGPPMGGPGGGGGAPPAAKQLEPENVWTILSKLLNGKKINKNPGGHKSQDMVQNPPVPQQAQAMPPQAPMPGMPM